MAAGSLTPLQLIAGSVLINNTGISFGQNANSAILAYTANAVVSAWQAAVNNALGFATPGVITQMLTIGDSVCAALGNSIPTGAPTPRPIAGPVNTGFSGLIRDTGSLYLGNGDVGKFVQAFVAANSYCNSINKFINSSVNSQTYLGPTFRGMSALVTNMLSDVNSDFEKFGVDLAKQGKLTNLENITAYGTPVGLLQQVADVANLQGGMFQGIETKLMAEGLTKDNIKTLIGQGTSVSENELNQMQKLAYTAMTKVTGSDLQTVLQVLDVTTPNINTMADLLNQQKIFPNSYKTLTTPSPAGPILIYQDNGNLSAGLEANVNNYLPTATGCEDLGKAIPPDMAVANKAVQTSLQQVTGITDTTLPALAQSVLGNTANQWDENKTYLPDAVVSDTNTIPTFYRAQQTVPANTGLNNTDYWKPTSLGGLNTMAGLPDIQSQTSAVPDNVANFYKSLATGTGPNGTIVISDILGAADGYGYVDNFTTVTDTINSLYASGALTNLYNTYVAMLGAVDDASLLPLISQANSDISAVAVANPTAVSAMNSAWYAMATNLNKEYLYQQQSSIIWADLPAFNRTSILAFVQSLPEYGLDVDAGGTAYFLEQVADTSTQGGQGIVGSLREGRNTARLNTTQLGTDIAPKDVPAVTPSPVVVPVY